MWEPEIVAMVVGTFLLAGFIKGVIGMGLPVVALAFLGSTLGVREALTIMLIPGLVTNTWQALGITFVAITLALGTSLIGRSLLTQDLALMSLTALVPTAAGLALGRRYRHHISEEMFKRIFFVALFVIGVDMLRRSIL